MKKTRKHYSILILIGLLLLNSCHVDPVEPEYTIYGVDQFEPFLFSDENNHLTGIEYDIFNAIASIENIDYQYKTFSTFSTESLALNISDKKQAFMGMDMGIEANLANMVDFSIPFFSTSSCFAIREEDSASIHDLYDLFNSKVVVLKGSYIALYLEKYYQKTFNLDISYADNASIIIEQLLNGSVQACFSDKTQLQYHIKEGVPLKIIGNSVNERNFGLAVYKGTNQELIEKFNNGFAKIVSNGSYYNIVDKYLTTEKNYFDIGIYSEHPPFAFKNEQGIMEGIDIDLINALSKRGNIDCRISYYPTSSEIVANLSEGRLDGALPIRNIEEQRSIFDFSVPYLTTSMAISVLSSNTDITSIYDLKGAVIAVEKNTEMSSVANLYKEAFDIDSILYLDNKADVIQSLLNKEAIACLTEKSSILYNIQKDDLPIKVIDSIRKTSLGFCVQKGKNKILLSTFNQVIADMINDGSLDAILEKYDYTE